MTQTKKIKVKDNTEVHIAEGKLKDHNDNAYTTEPKVKELIKEALGNVATAEGTLF
jgi:hypothetical protein